ncbi:hypothetical protein LOD99_344 [Oopsacas minuta]|uniref:Uncharacterized protein n=1 Tax=Oopsacas minuta TaxID=111878 RepID=A0AAV7K998_9METZ|nr:hypothetical protein LOD99_344 [Oopsacas minuta]
MASKLYVSIVTSILMSPINNGKRIKGFKKEYPPLPWYTGSEMEEIMREEQLTAETQDPLPKEDPVLQTLRQKDLKMKRGISLFLSEDPVEETKAKKVCIEPTESISSLSSDEMLTPTDMLSPVAPAPEVEAKRNLSGCFRLEEDLDIDASEYEYGSNRKQTISPKDTNQQNTSTEKEKQSSDLVIEPQDTIMTSSPNTTPPKDKDINTTSPEVSTTPIKDTPTLTEEEVADINRKSFILHYESMCRVVGLSKVGRETLLKEWQEQEVGSKTKPVGILKNPTERFDIKTDTNSLNTLNTPTTDKVVSFCIPQTSLATDTNHVVNVSQTSSNSNLPSLPTESSTAGSACEEPTTPILTPSPLIHPLPSAFMSTPLRGVPTDKGPVSSASFPKPPLISQDISIIPPITNQTKYPFQSLVTSPEVFQAPLSSKSVISQPTHLQTSFLAPIMSNPLSVLPTTSQAITPVIIISSSSNKPFNPLLFLSKSQAVSTPQSSLISNSLFKMPATSSSLANPVSLFQTFQNTSVPKTTQTISSASSLFQLPVTPSTSTSPAYPVSLFQTFQNPAVPKITQTISSGSSLFQLPVTPSSSTSLTSTSTPIFSFLAPSNSKANQLQPATNLLKSNKPFHNLELSYSIPTTSKPQFTPLAPSSFKPLLATNSPFQPVIKSTPSSFLPQDPPAPSVNFQANPVSAPAFQFNPQPSEPPLPTVPTFTSGIPMNFAFGQTTDTNSSAIFLGTGGGRGSGSGTSSGTSQSPYRPARNTFKKKRK